MRFAPISDRAQTVLLLPIIIPVAACAVAMFVCVAPIAYPWLKLEKWLRERRKARGWHRWYAWRPVEMNGFYYDRPTDYAWLEVVDRRWLDGWSYRYPDELDTWERREAAQGMEAGTAETARLGPKDDSPVGTADAPQSTPENPHA